MIRVLSSSIISPLGETVGQNYRALLAGRSALAPYDNWHGVPDRFVASLFSREQREKLAVNGYSRFESLAIRAVEDALSRADVDIRSPRTLFVLSTTKANVEELGPTESLDGAYLAPGSTARKIAGYFGMTNDPVVVCNACISGVTAQLLADRMIESGYCDHAVVCGIDCQSLFEVAVFQSFKSLSPEDCRPFDIERKGLNLGEAASAVIFGRCDDGKDGAGQWKLVKGCLDNDAYHLSAPSPDGAGTLAVISGTLDGWDRDDLAVVSAHGTATMFNDQMESVALERASLSSVPVSALKGYYGHTFGAAGVLEAVLVMRALDDGCILPVRGFDEIGVSGRISISNREGRTDKSSFLKIISGFGGCNGALLYSKAPAKTAGNGAVAKKNPQTVHSVRLTDSSLSIDGRSIPVEQNGKAMLTWIYRTMLTDWPKFYKMDVFNRLVYVASQLLVREENAAVPDVNRSLVFFNRSSTIVSDRKHISTICGGDGFFPSPSLAIFTLPNITAGEVAIRNGYRGETSFYILDERNETLMGNIVDATFSCSDVRSMITGWVDCGAEDTFEADMRILTI